jgi:hypothetical protein
MTDERPLAATGHLFLRAKGANAAAQRLIAVGVRKVVLNDSFAVLELRGGTHIVVRDQDEDADATSDASFDLMYDDVDAAHTRFLAEGFEVTDIKDGKIHRSFYATAPERFRLQVLDSHAGGRAI